MPYQNKLPVPGSKEMLERYKEEFGEELGIYHPAASRDLFSSRLAKELDHKKEQNQ